MQFTYRPLNDYTAIEPPYLVRVTGTIGPFVGMTGLAVGESPGYVWVHFEEGGSYPPCDVPGTYGLHPDTLARIEDDAEEGEKPFDCGHYPIDDCRCHLQDQYWSGTGESMADDSYIDYLNRS